MKRKVMTNKIWTIAIVLSAFIAFGYDLSTSGILGIRIDSFKLESEFIPIAAPIEHTQVAIVPSNYSGLANVVSRDIDPGYEQIEAMVRKAIELQGGFAGVIHKGDTVMLKINLVSNNAPSGQGDNTDVRVIKALIKTIYDFENDVHIIVAEGTARENDDFNVALSVWHYSGYVPLLTDPDLTGISLSFLNLNQTIDDLVEVNLGEKGAGAPYDYKYHVHKKEVSADVYISVPVLKIHNPGMTAALKNQIGTAPGCYYGYNKAKGLSRVIDGRIATPSKLLHDILDQQDWTEEEIVDLSNIAGIDFVVIDAIMCLQTSKGYTGTNQLRMNTIIAGKDPVAVDNVCTRLFSLNPDDIDHICLAEKMGLGTNNPDYIDVVGSSIADVKKRAKKSLSPSGRFGRSNRTWILSPAFTGTDISQQYIADEANYIPVAGKDGWSQPFYFFDDQIDLYSYYNGATNIVTYAFTNFSSPSDITAELWIGNHEAIYVYLNGALAYYYTSSHTYEEDEYGYKVATMNLKEGENSLLVKTLNTFGSYSFALNICEVEADQNYYGNRIDGLKFYLPDSSGKIFRSLLIEKTICIGDSYFVEGADQTEAGYYYDTIVGADIDTVYVTNLTVNSPSVNLGNDITVVKPNTLVLNAGAGFDSYFWNTDETVQSITIQSANETVSQRKYWVQVTDDNGCVNSDTISVTFELPSDIITVKDAREPVSIYPNPFTTNANISFELGEAVNASICVYDIQGKKVKTLENGFLTEGAHTYVWDGTSENDIQVQRGNYIITIQYGTTMKSIKIQKN